MTAETHSLEYGPVRVAAPPKSNKRYKLACTCGRVFKGATPGVLIKQFRVHRKSEEDIPA